MIYHYNPECDKEAADRATGKQSADRLTAMMQEDFEKNGKGVKDERKST
ncbi:MAG: hypothetical protein ABUJ92_00610 [Desulfobacterales bacterium]